MDTQGKAIFFVGDWQVSPLEGVVSRDGESVRLEPKAIEVLAYLASRPGEVVSRDDLEKAVWRGAIVGYDAVTNTVIKLRKALGDSSRHPTFIATIPKRGYQLIASVSFSEPAAEPKLMTTNSTDAVPLPASHGRFMLFPVGFIVVALVLASGFLVAVFLFLMPPLQESPDQGAKVGKSTLPTIVVLPFENLSDDPKQGPFADGITEDIITDLSGLSRLLVIGSNTSFTFKGTRVTPQSIGTELNVDFVLEGSIRRSGDSVRVNAQLVDTKTGFQKWANRYDRRVAEVFVVQDEVTSSIVKALALQLSSEEENRLAQRATDKLAAYDDFVEAQRLARLGTKEANIQAQAFYRSAIETDPNYGRAYGALAYTLAQSFSRRWTNAPVQTIDRALELAHRAVQLDSTDPHTHWSLGYVHLVRTELQQAQAAAIQTITMAPNFADGYALLSLIKNGLGEPVAAFELIEKGMKLNPKPTWNYWYSLAVAHFALDRIDEAIVALETALSKNPYSLPVRALLAVSYMKSGRQDDAEWEVLEIQAINPTSSISRFRHVFPIKDENLVHVILENLRAAGLPE